MCGIVGVMSQDISLHEQATFEDLMRVAVVRGTFGAGVIAIEKDKQTNQRPVTIHRHQGNGASLMTTKGYRKLVEKHVTTLIGHCRAPTKGAADNIDNVHPHISETICGVHNGTMFTVGGQTIKDTKSDSKAFYELIAKDGIEEAVKTSYGAYALVWTDNQTGTVNFLRNSERPLWFGSDSKEMPGTLFWASEAGMLHYILNRGIFGRKEIKVWELPANTLMSFPYNPGHVIRPGTVKEVKRPVVSSYNWDQGWVTDETTGVQKWRTLTPDEKAAGRGYEDIRTRSWDDYEQDCPLPPSVVRPRVIHREAPSWTPDAVRNILNKENKMDPIVQMQDRVAEAISRVQEGIKNDVIPFRNARGGHWRGIQSRTSSATGAQIRKLSKKEKKLAKRNGRDGHNAGHLTYCETSKGFYVSPEELVTFLHKNKCENCQDPGTLEEYKKGKLKWLTRYKFVCESCQQMPQVMDVLQGLFPSAFAGDKEEWARADKAQTGRALIPVEQIPLKPGELSHKDATLLLPPPDPATYH